MAQTSTRNKSSGGDEAVEWLRSVVVFSGVGLNKEPSVAERRKQFEQPKLEEFHQWTIANER